MAEYLCNPSEGLLGISPKGSDECLMILEPAIENSGEM
jgi:hypothetical protein